jgi:hypothetical protein
MGRRTQPRSTTSRLDVDGKTLYVVTRPDQTVVSIRSTPWGRGATGAPLHVVSDPNPAVALAKAQRWLLLHQAPDGATGPGGQVPLDPPPPVDPPMDPWDIDDDSEWSTTNKDDRVRLHQLQMIEARTLLDAYGIRTKSELRQRLNDMAASAHPDHGGDPAHWRRVHGAYRFLHRQLFDELPASYDRELGDSPS